MWKLLLLIVVVLHINCGVFAEGAGNTTIMSFNKSKKMLLKQVYHDHSVTFYCDCPFSEDKKINPCENYTPKKINKRSKRLEWEHIVPAHAFGQSFKEWREGHPDCINSKGKPFKGRKCAEKMSTKFRYMQSDMYNLVPAIGEINGFRSNYSFTMIPGEKREFGKCDMEIEDRKAEPPPDKRGDIARTYFYMDWVYPGHGIISNKNRKLFEAWAKEDPADQWECERAKRIKKIQGNVNPFVENDCNNLNAANKKEKFRNSLGMEFVYIKPGTFMMGSPQNEPERQNDETLHEVTFTDGFYMQSTEVTQGQWQAVLGNNPSGFKNCGENCPVERVSWEDVQEFISKMNKRETKYEYRLPTEAEWEYAARAGTTTPFSFGHTLSTDQANYNGEYPYSNGSKGIYRDKTTPAKNFPPNAWGLYDMHGNVWEWCQDWCGAYPSGRVTNPSGPSSGVYRRLRSGFWRDHANGCRSAKRGGITPSLRYYSSGFRLAASLVSQ